MTTLTNEKNRKIINSIAIILSAISLLAFIELFTPLRFYSILNPDIYSSSYSFERLIYAIVQTCFISLTLIYSIISLILVLMSKKFTLKLLYINLILVCLIPYIQCLSLYTIGAESSFNPDVKFNDYGLYLCIDNFLIVSAVLISTFLLSGVYFAENSMKYNKTYRFIFSIPTILFFIPVWFNTWSVRRAYLFSSIKDFYVYLAAYFLFFLILFFAYIYHKFKIHYSKKKAIGLTILSFIGLIISIGVYSLLILGINELLPIELHELTFAIGFFAVHISFLHFLIGILIFVSFNFYNIFQMLIKKEEKTISIIAKSSVSN